MNNTIEMKHARILFNNKKNETTGFYETSDILVAEFNLDAFKEAEKNGKKGSSVWPMYLYKSRNNDGIGYSSDLGNCNFDIWPKWTATDIIILLFVCEKYSSEKIREKAFNEMLKIKEVYEVIKNFNFNSNSMNFIDED